MRREARAANWTEVAKLNRDRDALLVAAPLPARRALIEDSIACNEELLELARAARASLATALIEFKRGRSHVRRYAVNEAP